jgi:homoserine dehydrogenase
MVLSWSGWPQAKGGHLKYGAAVAGGIPVIPGLEQGMAGDRIERIEGILNGTCNFILSKMETGAEYAAVLAEAQAKGYAEADPTGRCGRLRRPRQTGHPHAARAARAGRS